MRQFLSWLMVFSLHRIRIQQGLGRVELASLPFVYHFFTVFQIWC